MKVLIYRKSRTLDICKCRGYGANATTYIKMYFEKEVIPKNINVLRRNRNRGSKKVVNEDLASVSWQCRAWRQ